ncbi:MAG: peptidoglycan recognition family protein [Candidatus Nanopelagicales bacterium]
MAEHKPPSEVCNCGIRGWMPGVVHIPSKAVGGWHPAGKMAPIACVVHVIEGWQATMADSDWVSNSYHATFGLDGKIIQHVSVFDSAWHAGRLDSTDPVWALWRGRGTNVNSYTVGISAEGSVDGVEIPKAWTAVQVRSAIRFLKWLGQEAGITWNSDTLTEHSAIAVDSRRDPGPQWPKGDVLSSINEVDALTPEQLAVVRQIWAAIDQLTQDDIDYMLGLVGLDTLPPRPDPAPEPEPTPTPDPDPAPPAPEPTPGGSIVEVFQRLEAAERELADIRALAQGLL